MGVKTNHVKSARKGINRQLFSSIPKIQAGGGDSICASDTAYFKGTVCGVVEINGVRETRYLLTCSHVLSGGDPVDKGGDIPADGQVEVESPSQNFARIGRWSFGVLDDRFDVALVDTTGYDTPEPNTFELNPVSFRQDFIGKTVFINGAINRLEGFIAGQSTEAVNFDYNGRLHALKNLIQVSRYLSLQQSLTEAGDSGAMAWLSDTKEPLGMVVGANDQYTFLIPMTDILSRFNISFVTSP